MDIYCERVNDGFWAEPLNAVTNLAFLIVVVWVVKALNGSVRPAVKFWDLWLLVVLLALIGLGSFLWHTLATSWSALADVLPILGFIYVYLLSFLARVAKFSLMGMGFWFSVFLFLNYLVYTELPANFLNGSVFYLPAWVSLLAMTIYCRVAGLSAGRDLFLASLVFTVSLTLRSVDQALCEAWSLGTHFVWHLLNALVLYRTMRAIMPLRADRQRAIAGN
ncbi:MAG: hypothetical protein K1566_19300 [Candidatus Thiodiazotropha sp. (ex. Lucinisca nassula)]|nr:hypothetical protein [Candidatus Thiodiazotropha sp. (ex. Lucinisca nassula)]